jgi:hypothetical protein
MQFNKPAPSAHRILRILIADLRDRKKKVHEDSIKILFMNSYIVSSDFGVF